MIFVISAVRAVLVGRKPKGYWTETLGITPKEDNLEYQRRWRQANPGNFKEWKYGLTQEEYLELLKSQNFECAICETKEPKGRHNNWHIDHDHETGLVRSLLCWLCNSGLGKFKDSEELLFKAAEYVRKHKANG
jgi:hypothetical protein